ncbi:hypothetical protein [Paenibacillus sp. 1001270B_150601_E10]|uniref:hypothetical protein n=1 Tax=Paenibacillus sp. 1001270B_150601_E10 TaxID=2787079 RepID=UPI00189F316B|nr:hypothetical protein [Paenibacillus sp. 1001270B_150601_E10]
MDQRNRELLVNLLVVSMLLSLVGVLFAAILASYLYPNMIDDYGVALYFLLFIVLYIYNLFLSVIYYGISWMLRTFWKRITVFQLLGIVTLCIICVKVHVLAGAAAYSSFFIISMLSLQVNLREEVEA